ncbi:hypothetical protein [Phaeobacter sp. HF9A]|uniref:hypothetical protein n=1 Tax=Phaeobacter sp. HF9A TaxID=2721561 RepID=UPI0014311E33|nr:hypothetical protein [Phaeobacter sp. HF9A]NIZ13928.1 hypothetical protein [Phaeobacter sp. HF9A]
MQIAKFMDVTRVSARVDTDDQPISGGASSVMSRGFAGQIAAAGVDHLLLAASDAELEQMADNWGMPAEFVKRRARALRGALSHMIAQGKG